MSGDEFKNFEAELERLKPKPPPGEFTRRLALAVLLLRREHRAMPRHLVQVFNLVYRRFSCFCRNSSGRFADYESAVPQIENLRYRSALRWLVSGAVVLSITIVFWFKHTATITNAEPPPVAQAHPELKADNVDIDRQLVGAFDAVAHLPGGEPVRFRCQEWMDEMVLRDSARGVVIEQRRPHLEIVPVSFETY